MFERVSKKSIFFLTVVLTAILFMFPGRSPSVLNSGALLNQDRETASKAISADLPDIFENFKIEAKAVYIFDLNNNSEIFSKNAEMQLPLASLTKLMTAFLANYFLPSEATVVISHNAILQEGDSGFFEGEKWSASELTDFMLVSSSNDAAFAIAEAVGGLPDVKKRSEESKVSVFVRLMNQKAEELNLRQTFFLNPTGLDLSKSVSGAFGSAKDVAFLIKHIIKLYPDFFAATRYESLDFLSRENKLYTTKNTNKSLANIFQLVGGKTGFTDLSGGNLAVVADIGINHPTVIVILGSSEEGRFKDMENLVRAVYKLNIVASKQ
jgi:D-alanyl-D-alanine carboxypeptidase